MSELEAWVDKLGGMTTQEIRKLMQDEGIQGCRADSDRCPIAVFLQAKVDQWVCVFPFGIANRDGAVISASESIGEFIQCFDEGNYPELVRPRTSE